MYLFHSLWHWTKCIHHKTRIRISSKHCTIYSRLAFMINHLIITHLSWIHVGTWLTHKWPIVVGKLALVYSNNKWVMLPGEPCHEQVWCTNSYCMYHAYIICSLLYVSSYAVSCMRSYILYVSYMQSYNTVCMMLAHTLYTNHACTHLVDQYS